MNPWRKQNRPERKKKNKKPERKETIRLSIYDTLNEQQREALRAFAEAGGIKVEEQQEDGFFDKFKDAFGGKKRK